MEQNRSLQEEKLTMPLISTDHLFLVFAFFIIAALPTVPAALYALTSTAAEPLHVPSNRDDDPRYFSNSFMALLKNDLSSHQVTQLLQRTGHENAIMDKYIFVRDTSFLKPVSELRQERTDQRICLFNDVARLPEETLWLGDAYTPKDFELGKKAILRTLRCDGKLLLHPESRIIRWVDASWIYAMGPLTLPGRTSATQRISLSIGIQFERLFAPLIEVFELDASTPHEPVVIPSPPGNAERWSHQHDDTQDQQRKVFDDHLYIADNTSLSGDIVCHGDLYLGKNCRCEGNLKVDGHLYVDSGTAIHGHVFCLGSVFMGNDCQINGMTSVLNHFHSGLNCMVGSEKQPITLAAGEISLSAGSRIYGQIIARKKGMTTYA